MRAGLAAGRGLDAGLAAGRRIGEVEARTRVQEFLRNSKISLDNGRRACYALVMATYRTVKTISINADAAEQDRRIMDAANKAAAKRDEAVGSFIRRVLEIALGVRKPEGA